MAKGETHADKLTKIQCENLGKYVRQNTDNFLVRSFAAEAVGESYPLSASMSRMVFDETFGWADRDLGYRFAKWCDEKENA